MGYISKGGEGAMMRMKIAVLGASACILAVVGSATAQPGKTLRNCQTATSREGSKYVANYSKAVGKCMDTIAKELIQDGFPVAEAASSCARSLRKLNNTEKPTRTLSAKFVDKIERACDPAVNSRLDHVTGDVLNLVPVSVAEGIEAKNLDLWCTYFGGDGSIDTIQEWIACQQEALTCEAQQQLSVKYPRLLEWLDDIAPAITSLGAEPKFTDAAAQAVSLNTDVDFNQDNQPDLRCGPALSGPTGLPATGQVTSYGVSTDGAVQAGHSRSFIDNGDGTIVDNITGLMWEKKEDLDDVPVDCSSEAGSCANPHDADNRYSWTIAATTFNGSAASVFLEQLNDRCNNDVTLACSSDPDCTVPGGPCGFAGHRDWRLPNITELQSLLNYETFTPTTYTAFAVGCSASCDVEDSATCSCTVSLPYWSSTTYQGVALDCWTIDFVDGLFLNMNKSLFAHARAVRAGL